MKEHKTHFSLKEYWEKQNPLFEKIYQLGTESYIKTIPDLKKAFILKDRDLRCIDERTPGGLHLAGSGILMNGAELEKTLHDANIQSVWTHEECGAAKLYAGKNGLNTTRADQYAQEWGKALENRFGIKYRGHLPVEPSGGHIARVAYYDGTGTFDFQNVRGLPPGFVISRKYLTPDYAAAEIKVAIQIATGSHGFNSLITPQTPFILIAIGDSQNQSLTLDVLTKELLAIKANNSMIKVDGFVASHLSVVKNISSKILTYK